MAHGIILALIVGLVGLSQRSIKADDDSRSLRELANAYSAAREDSSSVWLNYKSCYVYLYKGGGVPSDQLASFDIDDTITKSKSGRFLPKDATDWQYLSPNIKDRVQQSVRDGQRLVFFTNQNGVGSGIVSLDSVQRRLEATAQGLEVPSTTFVAIIKDEFRKPLKGMYELFASAFNGDKRIDLDRSFYCGDATGPPAFSDSDLKFAKAIGLPFLDPEAFLRNDQPKKL